MTRLVYFENESLRADRISAVCKTEEEGLPSLTIFIGDNPNPMVFPYEHVEKRNSDYDYVLQTLEM